MSLEVYEQARKIGLRCVKTRTAEGLDPYLPALEDEKLKILKTQELPVTAIPLDRVTGTRTRGRTNSFAADFMPLLEPASEFAGKWTRLYEAQLEEGIREPILCVEYLGHFYVQEGNKRVSVLKYLKAPEIMAKVTRLIPENDHSPEMEAYFESLEAQAKTGASYLHFVTPGSWKRLDFVLGADDEPWSEKMREDVRSAWNRFSQIFLKLGGSQLQIPAGDAFLLFLEIYGLKDFDDIGNGELERQIRKVWADFSVWPEKPRATVETDTEEDRKSLLSRLYGEPRAAFIYRRDPETSAWTRHHEQGRAYLNREMPEVDTRAWFEVNTPEQEMAAMEEAVKKGYDVIFTTSPEMLRSSIRFGAAHPEIKMFNCSLNTLTGHIRTYFGRRYESQFLSGLIAGILTVSGHIGYLADYPIYGNIASLNAFALGALMTNPEARVYLDWSTTKESAGHIPRDTDLVFIAGIDFDPNVITSREFGLYDLREGKFVKVTYDLEYWGQFYTKMMQRIRNRRWYEEHGEAGQSVNYWWGVSNGMIDLEMTKVVPEQTRRLIGIVRENLRHGLRPFRDELRDQEGQIRCRQGETLSTEQLMDMDWLLSNIIGSIPGLDDFTDEATGVIRTHGISRVKESA